MRTTYKAAWLNCAQGSWESTSKDGDEVDEHEDEDDRDEDGDVDGSNLGLRGGVSMLGRAGGGCGCGGYVKRLPSRYFDQNFLDDEAGCVP